MIIHEDAHILVVDKPAGLLTSTVPGEKRATALAIVQRYVLAREPRARIGLIHRLDKDASGLLIFSKSQRAYESLKTQFFKHSVERIYEAQVKGIPNPRKGRIDSRLIERADGTVRSTSEHAKGQRAVTDYEVVRTDDDGTFYRVTLQGVFTSLVSFNESTGARPTGGVTLASIDPHSLPRRSRPSSRRAYRMVRR